MNSEWLYEYIKQSASHPSIVTSSRLDDTDVQPAQRASRWLLPVSTCANHFFKRSVVKSATGWLDLLCRAAEAGRGERGGAAT